MVAKEKTPSKTPKKNPKDNLRKGGFEKKQPTPAQKSAGRDRKKQAQRMMDMVLKYQTLTQSELIEMSKKKDLTVLELLMIRYVTQGMKDNKMLVDMLDRHISKAPTEQKIEHDGNITSNIVKIWQNKK